MLRNLNFLDDASRKQRLTRCEVLAALRGSGVADASGAAAVTLENDGGLSVIKA